MSRSLLILNPAAGAGRFWKGGRPTWRLDRLLRLLGGSGTAPELVITEHPGHATEIARAAATGAARVYACGGDGTLREAASGLLGSAVPLGLLPGGTANVLVSSLGWPSDPFTLAEAYGHRSKPRLRPLDVGRCAGRPFLMMASRGLDARVLRRVPPARKRRFGTGAVALQALIEWARRAEPTFTVEIDDHTYHLSFCAVCNIVHYGGRFALAPEASPYDGRLDALAFSGVGRLATLSFAIGVLGARHLNRSDTLWTRCARAVFLGEGSAWMQVDGDAIEVSLPVEVTLDPHRLALLVP